MKKAIKELQQKQPVLLKRDFAASLEPLTTPSTGGWKKLESISLSGHGIGKTDITFSACSMDTSVKRFEIYIATATTSIIASDSDCSTYTETTWRRVSASTTIEYDENTTVELYAISDVSHIPNYSYSILIFPD